MHFIRSILLASAMLFASLASAQASDPVRTGLWWNVAESGGG